MTADVSILARMTAGGPRKAATVPLASTRALRLAVTRAADRAFGLALTVSEVTEDLQRLDGVISGLDADDSYVALRNETELVGLIGMDVQLRAATIEMQTMGILPDNLAIARSHTGTDLMLAEPLCKEMVLALPITTQGSDLEGWADGTLLGDPFDSLRAAGLVLGDFRYRIMKITVDLTDGGRQGHMVIVLPTREAQASETLDAQDDDALWEQRMHASVSAAPATLDAVLYTMKLSLKQIDNLSAGQILPLYGATVGSVRLFAPDSTLVGTARLGQSGGMRAVRIEPPPDAYMRDIPPPAAAVTQEVD